MVAKRQPRASGEPGATEEAREAASSIGAPVDDIASAGVDKPRYNLRTPAFARMKWTNTPEERAVLDASRLVVDERMYHEFPDAYRVMQDIYEVVRDPVVINGEIQRDRFGMPVWQRHEDGWIKEDFTRLSQRQMEEFIFKISVKLFAWEQKAQDLWAESMFAKAQFEERYAIAYDASIAGTVEDRKNWGSKDAAEERYYAIFLTHLSRRAEALTRSMERLALRINDQTRKK